MVQKHFWRAQGSVRRVKATGTEHQQQASVINWANAQIAEYPCLEFLFAIPNAGAGNQSGQAGKMKAEGVKPGVPDLCLPYPRGVWHGLYIEMKRELGTIAPAQLRWHEWLRQQDYYIATAYGEEIAKMILTQYIRLPPYGTK